MNLGLIFLTGLTTGGLSCLAMQGGLLASLIANDSKAGDKTTSADQNKKNSLLLIMIFLLTKIVVHTIFGFFLGSLGSSISLSLELRLVFQTLTALFIFATAMNLLNIHPIFRYVVIKPPRFIFKKAKHTSQNQSIFSAVMLGFLTLFIPCGVTQAMELNAISSGSGIYGALLMFTFILGTMPIFIFLGLGTYKLSKNWQGYFAKIAFWILIGMSVYSLNGVLVVFNFPLTLNKITEPIRYFFSNDRFLETNKMNNNQKYVTIEDGVQKINLQVLNHGYYPKKFTVSKDMPIELTLTSNETYSCALAFVFRDFGINTMLKPNDSQTFELEPNKTGNYVFTCSMGMYSGIMEVI